MTTAAPKAARREWIGLAVIALPCLLYSMDLTVLHLAVPPLTADLKPGGSQLLWIVDIYGFLLAGFLITMGTLGDRIGRRRLPLIGAAAFGAASVVAAFSTSAGMLTATRALLGGAANIAAQLPAQLGAELLGTVRVAFARAFELNAGIGAAVLLALAVAAAVLLGRTGAGAA